MANIKNIDTLIAFIKAEREHFDMISWFDRYQYNDAKTEKTVSCGTVFCIGGAINYLQAPIGEQYIHIEINASPKAAAKWLGITNRSACHLFHMATIGSSYGSGWRNGAEYGWLYQVTAGDAIAALQELKCAGGVFNKASWKKVAPHAMR